jgi:hypothetical protein
LPPAEKKLKRSQTLSIDSLGLHLAVRYDHTSNAIRPLHEEDFHES